MLFNKTLKEAQQSLGSNPGKGKSTQTTSFICEGPALIAKDSWMGEPVPMGIVCHA